MEVLHGKISVVPEIFAKADTLTQRRLGLAAGPRRLSLGSTWTVQTESDPSVSSKKSKAPSNEEALLVC